MIEDLENKKKFALKLRAYDIAIDVKTYDLSKKNKFVEHLLLKRSIGSKKIESDCI